MTVYLAFNEGEGLEGSSTYVLASSEAAVSGRVRSGFCLGGTNGEITRDTTFTGISEGWIHFNLYLDSGSSSLNTAGGTFLSVLDSDGNTIVSLSRGGNDQRSEISVDSVLEASGETTFIGTRGATLCQIDMHIKLDETTGFIRVYLDKELPYDKAGNTVVSTSGTTFDTLRFRTNSTVTPTGRTNYSELIVSDTNTIDAKVWTIQPTQAGTVNDWFSGDYTDVDETDVDDSDFAFTDTALDEFAVDSSVSVDAVSGPVEYTAVVTTFRASYDSGASVTGLTPFLNDTTATSTSYASTQSLTTGLANYSVIYSTDPADSGTWTADRINNYEYGVRAET